MINTSDFIPYSGNDINFFDRLKEYVIRFDVNWEKIIKGVSDEKLETLFDKIDNIYKGFTIPAVFRIYMEKLGENDGGILYQYTNNHDTDINSLLEYYKYINPIELEMGENCVVFGVNCETSTEIYMEFIDQYTYNIKRVAGIDDNDSWFSSTFEKMIFQAVLLKYISFYFSSSCQLRVTEISNINATNNPNLVFKQIEDLFKLYNYKKMWISDDWNLILYNNRNIIYVKVDCILYGKIWGDDIEEIEKISQLIKSI